MVNELEMLRQENQRMKEKIAELVQKLVEGEEREKENKRAREETEKAEKSAQCVENERLKMMLELANKEIAVLYNTFSARTNGTDASYLSIDQTAENNIAAQLDYYKRECARYENSTCWRITKPLRIVMDFLKKLFHK